MNIVLTGGSRGLGLEIARKLLEAGDCVYVVNRTLSSELATLLASHGERGVFVYCDLSKPEHLSSNLMERIPSEIPIHGLVNNAAIAYDDIVSNLALDAVESMFRVNVMSPMALTKWAIRNMLLHRTAGSMVHISSICTHKGFKGLAMYAATKGALEAFSVNVAREWGAKGIRSNCVLPGFMETEMSANLSESQREKIYSRTALGRATSIQSVAETVSFLLSEGSCSVTGQEFIVDSGTL